MIGIVEYGSGNVAAIANVLAGLKIDFVRISQPTDFEKVEKLILPGVGAFDAVMGRLVESGLREPLERAVQVEKKPVLGICVGMQILADSSEEGTLPGLGWVPGCVKRVDVSLFDRKPALPHMGWNSIRVTDPDDLFRGIDLDHGFYFLHSYRFECYNPQHQVATVNYGDDFTVAVRNGNVLGVQFHPEKSHGNGTQLIANFSEL